MSNTLITFGCDRRCALSNSSTKLEVIDWAVNPDTGVITRKSSSTVGGAYDVAISTMGNGLFTAAMDSHSKVDAGIWAYNGAALGQLASQQEESTDQVSAAPLNSGYYSVTATRTLAGDLQVDVWNSYSIQ